MQNMYKKINHILASDWKPLFAVLKARYDSDVLCLSCCVQTVYKWDETIEMLDCPFKDVREATVSCTVPTQEVLRG